MANSVDRNCARKTFCATLGVSLKNKMGGACSTYRGEEGCIRGFSGKIRETETLGRPRRKWDDNIKMDLPEVGW